MKNKITTAEDFYRSGNTLNNKLFFNIESYDEGGYLGVNENELFRMMREFAKLHRKAILEAVAEKVTLNYDYYRKDEYPKEFDNNLHYGFPRVDGYGEIYAVDVVNVNKDSILNAYPENLIK